MERAFIVPLTILVEYKLLRGHWPAMLDECRFMDHEGKRTYFLEHRPLSAELMDLIYELIDSGKEHRLLKLNDEPPEPIG